MKPDPSAPSGAPRPHPRALLVAACLLLAFAGRSGADGEDPAKRLSDARSLEIIQSRHAEALGIYQQILETTPLPPQVRGDALLGLARCQMALGHPEEAERAWDRVLADETLPPEVREKAQQEKARRITERSEADRQRAAEEATARAREEQGKAARERALRYVEEARAALGQRRFEAARDLVLTALANDPGNPEAEALLQDIAAKIPDRMELVRTMIEFFYSSRLEGFQRLRQRVEALEREGRVLFGQQQYEMADGSFRKALSLMDQSEFLADLADDRANLVIWLRRTREDAKKRGLTLPPEPPLPDPSAREVGYRGRFFQLLSEIFTAHEDQGDPLAIYEASPAPVATRRTDRSLGPSTFPPSGGITLARTSGALTRARWAERVIRATIEPGTWPTPTRSGEVAPGGAAARRLLQRYGDLLVVQHTKTVQDKVAEMLAAFAEHPVPLQVDVTVFAASEGGSVRASDRLRARAVPQESGVDLVVSGRLIEECTRDLQALEAQHLTPLGTAQVVLRGESSATLDLTQITERHPLHQGLKPPALTVPDADSRYGLSLEIYAEDLPHATTPARSAALSVRARARWPVTSVVVPKTTRAVDWTRLPKFAEQVVESDRRVPHFGTLLLLGVVNPFSPSATSQPDLVILVGVRPAAEAGGPAPIPDTPRNSAVPPPVGEDAPERGHLIGSLATEVLDDVVLEGWPQRPASLPVPPSVAAEDRAAFLAQLLAEQAGVWKPGGPDPNPVSVREGSAYARLSAEQQERVAASVLRLARQETALYEIDLLATETTEDRALAWSQMPGVQKVGEGRYLVDLRSAGALDGQMRANEDATSPYAARATLLARATQKVALRQLRTRTIVEDLRPRRGEDGSVRYVPLTGRAEEGIVVEVRPGLDEGGRRVVRVRLRAARLEGMESVPIGGADQPGASVQVPRWFPPRDVSAAGLVGDGEAVLLLVQAPDGSGRAIALKASTRRLQ